MIKNLLRNWKTTSAGLVMIGGSIIHVTYSVLQHTANENTWTIGFSTIVGGIGLMLAGDANASQNNKTNETDGTK